MSSGNEHVDQTGVRAVMARLQKTTDDLLVEKQSRENEAIEEARQSLGPGPFLLDSSVGHHTQDSNLDAQASSTQRPGMPGNTLVGGQEGRILVPGLADMRTADNRVIHVHDYLGSEYSDMIKHIHAPVDLASLPDLPGQKIVLHDHQKVGVAILDRMCRSPFRGGILADGMGLGKTFTAIAFLQHRRAMGIKGSFDVVVCHKNLLHQWKREIARFQSGPQSPRLLLLDNKFDGGALRLLRDQEVDIVLVSFHRVLHNEKRRVDLEEQVAKAARMTDPTKRKQELEKVKAKRRHLTLHSEMYLMHEGNMVRHLVIDESHFVKNPDGKIHSAVKGIPASHVIQLTGTPFANRWHDVFGLTDLQHGQVFGRFQDFRHVFADPPLVPGMPWGPPGGARFERLVKFVQPMMLARPASIIALPGLVRYTVSFMVGLEECEQILKLLNLFLREVSEADTEVGLGDCDDIIVIATKAQQLASHAWLLKSITSDGRLVRARSKKETIANLPSHLKEILDEMMQVDNASIVQEGNPVVNSLMARALFGLSQVNKDASPQSVLPVVESGTVEQQADVEDLVRGEHVLSKTEGQGRVLWKKLLFSCGVEELLSPRMTAVMRTYRKIRFDHPEGKVIIFSTFLQALDIVEAILLRQHGVQCFRYDGSVADGEQRDAQLQSFRLCKEPARPLLMTKDAGSVGLNITEASHVVLVEPWWTATQERQAISRVHRQGQADVVHVWHVFCENSAFEAYMRQTQERKDDLNQRLMDRLTRGDEEVEVPNVRAMYSTLY